MIYTDNIESRYPYDLKENRRKSVLQWFLLAQIRLQ